MWRSWASERLHYGTKKPERIFELRAVLTACVRFVRARLVSQAFKSVTVQDQERLVAACDALLADKGFDVCAGVHAEYQQKRASHTGIFATPVRRAGRAV